MPNPADLTNTLRDEYEDLFAAARIRPERVQEVASIANRIFAPASLARYQAIEAATNVPAHVVGIIHNMEASGRFNGHIHNGDPLTARTVQVPAGQPKTWNPPFTWETSAIDALTLKHLEQWTDWSVAGIAFVLEGYNGFGYRKFHPHVKSPYLWSYSTIYTSGKYVADGKWSDTAVSKQCGGMAILKHLVETGRVNMNVRAVPQDEGEATITPHVTEGVAEALPTPPPYPGHTLRNQSNGPEVRLLQQRLLDLGIREVVTVDGEFGDDPEHAVKLFQARSEDDAGEPLVTDGVVGSKTWRALFGVHTPPVAPPAETMAAGSMLRTVLDIAAEQIGEREVPLGSNRGPMVDQYLQSVSPGLLGQPWCMAFVHWCFQQAAARHGMVNPAPKTAHVWTAWETAQTMPGVEVVTAAEAVRDSAKVVPGMVFFLDTGGRTGHTGFVSDIVQGRLVTIEGNTNDGGSREGIGVFTRAGRRMDSINLGFVRFA